MFWRKVDFENRLLQLNEILKKSFVNVKKDTANIFQWLNLFYRKTVQQDQIIRQIQLDLASLQRIKDDIRRLLNERNQTDNLTLRVRDLEGKFHELYRRQYQSFDKYAPHLPGEFQAMAEIEKRLEKLEQKRLSAKERILKRLTRNSKEYLKGIIISYIKKYEKVSAFQLKETVVDEQRLCSKGTFYRLLEEIDEHEGIAVMKHGKEKHYISKVMKNL